MPLKVSKENDLMTMKDFFCLFDYEYSDMGIEKFKKKVCVHMVKNLLDSRPVISIRFSKGCNKLRSNGDVSIGPT